MTHPGAHCRGLADTRLDEAHQQHGGDEQGTEPRTSTAAPATVSNPRALPPTPPLQAYSGFDSGHQSPSGASSRSSNSAPQHSSSAINNVDPHQQRQTPHPLAEPYSVRRTPSESPYLNSPYASSPGAMSAYSYPSPAQNSIPTSGMYYQRPLQTTYPPPDLSTTMTPPLPTSHNASPIDNANPWQHHHYISPSASAAFAGQTQDRYVCQTCNKAFSRPSSLRIHSHSHTGEKPFKCQHTGCGKAFSVRSNMKRHERGCHGGGSPGSAQ